MKFLFFFLFFGLLYADDLTFDPPSLWDHECSAFACPFSQPVGMTFDLHCPHYEKGGICTDQGGLLRSDELFVQAKNIRYDREKKELFCSEELFVTFNGHAMTGKEFYFNFETKQGFITCATTSFPPWHLRADVIRLLEDGSLQFEGGYITTSEGEKPDLILLAKTMSIDPERRLHTSSLQVKIHEKPIMVLPGFTLDLTHLRRPPIEVKFGFGGYLGPHVSLLYHAVRYQAFKASLRLDGFLDHGLGVGVETTFNQSPVACYTRNYWAHDLAIDDPTRRNRYRFQGSYANCFDSHTQIRARYDYVSDAQMAADYNHHSFSLNPSQESTLFLHHQESAFLTNLDLTVRVNSFQSVDQQLPSLSWHLHPLRLGSTGCIFENRLNVSNIHFLTSNQLINQKSIQSLRLDVRPQFYYPIQTSYFSLVPKAGLIAIGYSNSPTHEGQSQILGNLSTEATTRIIASHAWGKHLLIPHVRYTHLTTPTSQLDDHFIFSLEDGYIHFDELRFGLKQLFFFPCTCQPVTVDLWANSFFDPQNHSPTLPKSYLDSEWQMTPTLFYHLGVGVHYGSHFLDFFNSRIEWSLSERAGLNLEYRYRGPYAWRKADFYNFILDVGRSEEALLASPLSDQRTAFLATLFYRVNPDWNLTFTSRYGKHADQRRSYFEYELESRAMILDHWWLHFSYQHRESDSRFAFSLKLLH